MALNSGFCKTYHMKKFSSHTTLLFGMSQYSEAQLQFGILRRHSDSFNDVSNEGYLTESKTGYHRYLYSEVYRLSVLFTTRNSVHRNSAVNYEDDP